MKKHFLHIAAMLTILLTVGMTATAQTTKTMTVTVPFDFYVGKTALPAGTYTLYNSSLNSGDGFLLATAEGTKIFVNAQQVLPGKGHSAARIEFRRYDEKYFLAEIWSGGSELGRGLRQSKLERDTVKRAERNVAQKDVKPVIVTISGE